MFMSAALANWFVGGHTKPDFERVTCITPLQFKRRQLHKLQEAAGGIRKREGSTNSLGFKRAQTTPEATAKKSTSQKEAMKLFLVKNKGWSGSAVKSFWTPELKKQQAERFKPQKLAAIGGAAAKKKLSGIPRTEAVKEKMRIGQRAWMTPEQIKARAAAVKDAMASRRCYYGA